MGRTVEYVYRSLLRDGIARSATSSSHDRSLSRRCRMSLLDASIERSRRRSDVERLGGHRGRRRRIVKGSDLAGTIARHPMHHLGGFYAEPRPFLPGEFVTTDSGTGLVHMAPDHGEDDFELCKAHRHRAQVRGRGRRPLPRGLGRGCRAPTSARCRSSTPSSTRPTGRSARTCAKRALCSARPPIIDTSYPH